MLAPQLISLVTGYFARLSSDCDKAVTDGPEEKLGYTSQRYQRG